MSAGFDLEHMVLAVAFHKLLFPDETNQLRFLEFVGGGGVLNAQFKQYFRITDPVVVERVANDCAVIA